MLIALKLLGSIALLIYGMKVMSEALQKMAGPQLRHLLGAMTTNRFSGVATGALVTVAVQSSAATTVMTVSFVNAALLTLTQAISVIMGANIGTTMSAWIMSAGFSFNIANVVWPFFLLGIVLIQTGRHRYIGDFLFGLSFLLFALGMLKATGVEMDLASKPAVVDFFAQFKTNYGTILLFLLIGTILTAIVQSSAALMAITMVLCATGAITIFQGIALVMGENIGTTVTANLAAMSANTQARRTAMAHLLFNVFGVVWVLIFFFPFVRMVCGVVDLDPTATEQDPTKLSFALATFHTFFNLINTAILIWFVPQIEKLVCAIIKPKKTDEEDEFRLQYIRGGIMKTPELSVFQAQKEIVVFGERMQRLFGLVRELYATQDDQAFEKLFERIQKGEDVSDRMENEIGRYLGDVGSAHLSDDTKQKIRAMMREIGELESVGDSCFNLARIMRRKREHKVWFDDDMNDGILEMYTLIDEALTQMNKALSGHREDYQISDSAEIEKRINDLRNQLKKRNIANLDQQVYGYELGTVLSDLIAECEKAGDYVINVVEARLGAARNAIRYQGLQIDTDARRVSVDGVIVPFTNPEYELLKRLMENPGVSYTREQLISGIWTDDSLATARTVDATVSRIRRKIGAYANHIGFSDDGFVFQEDSNRMA
ncbi:MAG: Na/Pi symporter [Bacteroidales bacterium]|nr:Na/Pi symporter [Bacteroidales bacterium]